MALEVVGVFSDGGCFEVLDDVVSELHGLDGGFHGASVSAEFFVSEVVGVGAGGNDQVIVGDVADVCFDGLCIGIDFIDVGDADAYVFTVLEDFSEREGDAAGFEAGCCDLVEEGLELVEIVFVDEGYVVVGVVVEGTRQFKSSKTASEDDDVFFVCHCFVFSVSM